MPKLSREDREIIDRAKRLATDGVCLICGEPATKAGFWETARDLSPRPASNPGNLKVFGFGLCDHCDSRPDLAEVVERIILARWEIQRSAIGSN